MTREPGWASTPAHPSGGRKGERLRYFGTRPPHQRPPYNERPSRLFSAGCRCLLYVVCFPQHMWERMFMCWNWQKQGRFLKYLQSGRAYPLSTTPALVQLGVNKDAKNEERGFADGRKPKPWSGYLGKGGYQRQGWLAWRT